MKATWPLPSALPVLFHQFRVAKLLNSPCVWLHSMFDTDQDATRKLFADTFGYIIPDGITFDQLSVDRNNTKFFLAERYGGFGVGSNGGGVRCGSLGAFQVKGCGKNLLAGPDQDVHHSYGGFKALYAIHEAIYSSILETILPLGAVRIPGVILTGAEAAYIRKDIERGWGALMVRDNCLRPANFMRARAFRPAKETARVLLSDVARVRKANRDLYRLIEGEAGFELHMKKFLRNSANQFAFARLVRLSHGAVTASNIAIDGRWLDLTNTSFTSSAVNTGGNNMHSPNFYEEVFAAIPIAKELISTFAKYNNLEMGSEWVDDFYRRHVDIFMRLHLPYLFGQPTQHTEMSATPAVPQLMNTITRILTSAPTTYNIWPNSLSTDDAMVMVVDCLFRGMTDSSVARGNSAARLNISALHFEQLIEEFSVLLRQSYTSRKIRGEFPAFVIRSYVIAMRRACLIEYFFKGRLGIAIDAHLGAEPVTSVGPFMEDSIQFGRWALSADAEDDILFRSPNCTVRLSENAASLILSTSEGERQGNAAEILDAVKALPDFHLHIQGFSCSYYVFNTLSGLIDFMESNVASPTHPKKSGSRAGVNNVQYSGG